MNIPDDVILEEMRRIKVDDQTGHDAVLRMAYTKTEQTIEQFRQRVRNCEGWYHCFPCEDCSCGPCPDCSGFDINWNYAFSEEFDLELARLISFL